MVKKYEALPTLNRGVGGAILSVRTPSHTYETNGDDVQAVTQQEPR